MNAREKAETLQSDWILTYLEGTTVEASQGKQHHTFTFDSVFNPDTPQENIYNISARPCIQDVLEGYNGTIFAYGQSGSGKTFTMFGPEKPFPDELKGVIPRASEHIFDHIESDEQMSYAIKCSFLEIYKENIRDLLAPSTTATIAKENIYLKIRESPTKGVWVEGLTEEFATCEQDIDDLIALGDNSRSVASTGMNQRSSRSHTMFVISIEQKATDGSTKTGRLNLIDLAGSEKISKTGAKGETLEEAKKINQSLSALGKCINALTTGKGHIPYRESKLTRILQESLGGNTKTTLIVTCSPHAFNAEETISTLQFGQRAKTIKNKVTVNRQLSVAELEAELRGIQKEYNACKVYSTKLESQIAWMRSPDYDANKPMPAHLVATKPATTTVSSASRGTTSASRSPHSDHDDEDDDSFDSSSHSHIDSEDEELLDGSEAIAIAETKLELQKLRDEIDMDVSMLKDEILTLQARLEDKKQLLDGIADDIHKQSSLLDSAKSELRQQRDTFASEIAKSLTEKKEKEDEFVELQKEFQKLSEETTKLQSTLAESDENFLVLFTENETIRSLLTAHLKELHNTNQAISNFTRQIEQLTQKAQSSKAESDMLEKGIGGLEKEVAVLENKKATIGADHKTISDKLVQAKNKLSQLKEKVSQLTAQLTNSQNVANQQKETLHRSEESIQEWTTKYNATRLQLRTQLDSILQDEAALAEKWKGQSQKLTDIKNSLGPDRQTNGNKDAKLTKEKQLEDLQKTLQTARASLKQVEDQYHTAHEKNMALDKTMLTLNAATKVATLEKEQILRSQDSTSVESSSSLLETLSLKLKRLQEEKVNMEKELASHKHDETLLAEQDANWVKQVKDLDAVWKGKQHESSKLQASLTKESSRLTTNAALVASQTTTIKQQKERLAVLKATLKTTRESSNALHQEVDQLQAKRDELEKILAEKEKLRHEAQRNAVEAARLREQMLQRRRVASRATSKKGGLLEAFQQKVDIESQRAGLKHTGSLFLQEARDEHYRSMAYEQRAKGSPTPVNRNESVSPSARKRMSLARRPSISITDLGTVRVGGNKLTAAEIALYEQMFSHYDKDKSGSIDSNELKALLSELGCKVTDDLMDPLMKELDKDGNGLIEFPEFLHGMDYLNNLSTNI